MEQGTRRVLLTAIAIISIIGIVVAFDYFAKQKQLSDYVSTPEGEVPKELQEGFNSIDPSIPADYPTKIDLETMKRYVQQAKDSYPGDENKEIREYMISEVAQLAGNAEPCAEISDPDIRDSCYFGVAIDTNNAELCNIILYGKGDCYTTIAKNTGDASLCEKADYEYQICLEAGRKKDMSLCSKVGDFREYCNSAAFPGCNNETFKEGTCNDFGDSLPPGDISECEKIPKYKEICYGWVALTKGDASLCSKTIDKEGCYNSVGILTNNINACNLAGSLKDNCIAWVAYNTDNVSICDLAGAERQTCIEDLAFKGSE